MIADAGSGRRPYAGGMRFLPRFRERLVLGPIRRYLDGDEEILAWTHARIPELRAPGVLAVTNHHCLLHVASSAIEDISTPLRQLSGFNLDRHDPEVVRVLLYGNHTEVHVELSLESRVRSRSVGAVLNALSEAQVSIPSTFNPNSTSPLPPIQRRAKHHARRIWITVAGVFVLLASLVLAMPGVPGPGALIAVAGIAILAREYEWARDIHVWASRLADRCLSWARGMRRRRVARSAARTAARTSAHESSSNGDDARKPPAGIIDHQ